MRANPDPHVPRNLPVADLDRIILRHLWPAAVGALSANGLAPSIGPDATAPADAIETRANSHEATRALTIVVEDPALERLAAPWYCRLRLDVSRTAYTVHRTTILSFPADFDLHRLAALLRDPLMAGCPPTLAYWQGGPGATPGYDVTLDTAEGAGWGHRDPATAARHVHTTVHDHATIVRTMERLARDWSDGDTFDELHAAAVSANTAY